jgi:hypothetical protein
MGAKEANLLMNHSPIQLYRAATPHLNGVRTRDRELKRAAMTDPGRYYGFSCHECGGGLPVERIDRAASETGARPIAIGAWEIRCPACGLVDNYGGGGKPMIRILIEKTESHT